MGYVYLYGIFLVLAVAIYIKPNLSKIAYILAIINIFIALFSSIFNVFFDKNDLSMLTGLKLFYPVIIIVVIKKLNLLNDEEYKRGLVVGSNISVAIISSLFILFLIGLIYILYFILNSLGIKL